MSVIERIKRVTEILYTVVKRFPLSIAMSAATAFILIFLVHHEANINKEVSEILGRAAGVCALGFPLFLCISLIFERKPSTGIICRITVYITAAAALILYYFFALPGFNMVSVTRYIGLSLALYLAFLFIPYFYGKESFELYVIRIFSRFFVTIIYSLVLFAGLAAIIFTVNKLLGIPIREEIYVEMFLIVTGIFAPTYLLGGVPAGKSEFVTADYPKLFKVLLLYIVMPILSVYTVILYAYFAKIIIITQWPVGLVAHLVLWYSIISIVVIFFILPLYTENSWAKIFTTWLSRVILPLLVIMFISIGIRVKAYGVTENRYFVVLTGIWITAVMLYFIISRKRHGMALLVSLAVVAFIAVFGGPLSAYSISINSQTNRFHDLLVKNEMLQKGNQIKPSSEVSKSDKVQMSEIITYFSNNHSFNALKYLPNDFKLSDMEKVLGFTYESDYPHELNNEYFSYYSGGKSGKPVVISGYDYMFDFRAYYGESSKYEGEIKAVYSPADKVLSIYYGEKKAYEKKISEYIEKIHIKIGNQNKNEVTTDDLTVIDNTGNVNIKIIFTSINGNIEKTSGKINIDSAEFLAFVRVKS